MRLCWRSTSVGANWEADILLSLEVNFFDFVLFRVFCLFDRQRSPKKWASASEGSHDAGGCEQRSLSGHLLVPTGAIPVQRGDALSSCCRHAGVVYINISHSLCFYLFLNLAKCRTPVPPPRCLGIKHRGAIHVSHAQLPAPHGRRLDGWVPGRSISPRY